MSLFRQWEAAFAEAANPTISESKAAHFLDICSDLEKEMLAQPAADIRDFAAKVLVNSGYGDFALSAGLIEEAKTIVARATQ